MNFFKQKVTINGEKFTMNRKGLLHKKINNGGGRMVNAVVKFNGTASNTIYPEIDLNTLNKFIENPEEPEEKTLQIKQNLLNEFFKQVIQNEKNINIMQRFFNDYQDVELRKKAIMIIASLRKFDRDRIHSRLQEKIFYNLKKINNTEKVKKAVRIIETILFRTLGYSMRNFTTPYPKLKLLLSSNSYNILIRKLKKSANLPLNTITIELNKNMLDILKKRLNQTDFKKLLKARDIINKYVKSIKNHQIGTGIGFSGVANNAMSALRFHYLFYIIPDIISALINEIMS